MCETLVSIKLANATQSAQGVAGLLIAARSQESLDDVSHGACAVIRMERGRLRLGSVQNVTEAPPEVFASLCDQLEAAWSTGRYVTVMSEDGTPLVEGNLRKASEGAARWLTQYAQRAHLRLIK